MAVTCRKVGTAKSSGSVPQGLAMAWPISISPMVVSSAIRNERRGRTSPERMVAVGVKVAALRMARPRR